MVNPLGHWLRVLFCTRSQIHFRGLSGSWGIGILITLRVLSNLRVPPWLVVPAHPLPVPVRGSFYFSISFLFTWHIWVLLLYGAISGGVLWHSLTGFYFPLPRICGNGFVGFCFWPIKISCLLLKIFVSLTFRWLFFLPLYCPLPPVWVVKGGPYLIGMSL